MILGGKRENLKPKWAVQQGMAGAPGVKDAWLVQGSCLWKRERQPGVGQPSNLGICLGYGKWRSGFLLQLQNTQQLVLTWALGAGEWKELQWMQVRCLWSVLCALPFYRSEGGFLSWCLMWTKVLFGHGFYPKALQELLAAEGRLGEVLECQNPWLGCVRCF